MTINIEQIKRELLELLEQKAQTIRYNKFSTLFPETGPFRRELYSQHLKFMAAGSNYMERALIAANGTGKTVCGSYEAVCHLTGIYPDWWKGRKFLNPINMWCVGVTNAETKKVLQKSLLGKFSDIGSGMLPKHLLHGNPKMKSGMSDAVEMQNVCHISGGISELWFMSVEQGRAAFQGDKVDVVWLDEEPKDAGVYSECLTRLRDPIKPGIIYSTYTPLLGLSDITLGFFPGGCAPRDGINPLNKFKFALQIGVYDVPHLTPDYIERIKSSYSPHEWGARLHGNPSLGSGAIYPYPDEGIVCDPFEIPCWWPRCYGFDVGWNKNAALWLAQNPDTKEIFIYSEHYQGKEHPSVHASAIKARGDYLTGAIDVASKGTMNQKDGEAFFDLYTQEGLRLVTAKISPEAGVLKINQMFAAGQLKIFSSCVNTLAERRMYRRDENGKIVKENDHAMDALRYAVMLGMEYMSTAPDPDVQEYMSKRSGFDEYTGY